MESLGEACLDDEYKGAGGGKAEVPYPGRDQVQQVGPQYNF